VLSPSVCPFLRRLSHGCMLYQSKRLKLVSCNFHSPSTYPSIRPSVSQSIHSPVFIVRLPCASAPYAVVRPSVRPSICLSVPHMGKSVKTRLNLISHRFQHSTVYMQNALYDITYIRSPSVCPSVTLAVNTRQHIRMYSVYAVVCPSVSYTRPSVKHG